MDRLYLIIHERDEFEDEMYETLVTPLFIPDDFWEPVVVSLTPEQIENFEIIDKTEICFICNETIDTFSLLKCCNKDMCVDCNYTWFNRSVFCPFCKCDQRTLFNLNNFI